ncbi:MAG: ROK family protein [Calditrichaeota bacterium]|nr:ROK family protein [Calditrichota bacterium]
MEKKKEVTRISTEILGVDIGGSGIKGAPVNSASGKLLAERHRISTPNPATPKSVARTLKQLVDHFEWSGKIGCGFPSVIHKGIARTASNIDKKWIGVNVEKVFSAETGCLVAVVNDADAAGLAEMKFGVGKGRKGVVILVTIGTGIGTAIFVDGKLLPNTELGHLVLKGEIAEHYASAAVLKRQKLTWEKWGKRVNRYLQHLEFLFSPDLFILGGGVSKKFDLYKAYLQVDAEITPAALRNEAGIVGASLAAQLAGG